MTRRLSRRDFLQSGAASAILLASRPRVGFASSATTRTAVNFQVPEGASDCHTHVFGDPRRFPFATDRAYTPEPAGLDELQALHRALRIDRAVIVQPSVYGTDNSCTLDAMRQLGPGARGIAVIDDKTSRTDLDEMHRAGIRGIRINLETVAVTDPAFARQRFETALAQIKHRKGWHIQIYTRPSVIAAIENEVSLSKVPVVFDHFGGLQTALGAQQPDLDVVMRLLLTGRIYVKLSAPYRSSTQAPDYADVAPFVQALIAANPHRLLWGSDWPHPQQIAGRSADQVTPPYAVDDGRLFNNFLAWVFLAADRKKILVENPARLYGF